MLDVRRLRLLYELSRRGTLAAVATALHVSPSSVSQQLAQLEAEAGVRLLNHVGRGVRLTEAARMLAAHAEIVVRELELAEARLASFDTDVHGTIRIASFQTATLALLPSVLHRLAVFAELRVELAQVEPELALPRLLNHEFDLVLAEEFGAAPLTGLPGLAREDLCHDPMWLATPPGTDRGAGTAALKTGPLVVDPMDLARLSQATWVMEPEGTITRAWAVGLCRASGFEPTVRFESADLIAHVALVESGHAVGFIPDLLPGHLRSGIALHPLPDQRRTISTVVRRESAGLPAVRAMRSALRAAVAAADPPDRSVGVRTQPITSGGSAAE